MREARSTSADAGQRRELVVLLGASLACAGILVLTMAERQLATPARLTEMLGIVVACGAGLLALMLLIRRARGTIRSNRHRFDEIATLRRSLSAAEAIVKSEPQVLIHWQQGEGVQIAVNSLTTVPGLPADPQLILRFGQWLQPGGARELKASLDGLFGDGRPFELLLVTTAGGHLEASGRVSGGRAILRLRDVTGAKRDLAHTQEHTRQLSRDLAVSRRLLDALPLPVWFRGGDGRIDWVNKAYVGAVEAADEAEVTDRQIDILEARQRVDARLAVARGDMFSRRLSLNIGGVRKAHDVVMLPFADASAGAAIDVTAAESARGELDRQIEAYDRTLDRVATAVAIFGPDRRLTFHNQAYARLWRLDAEWLGTHPTDAELLDALRERGRLPDVVSRPEESVDGNGQPTAPEAVDYKRWKARVLAAAKGEGPHEEGWYLPDGSMLHVIIEPRPDGGTTHYYDDVTRRIALESRYNALIEVQRETLDNIREGIAAFGTDGRLRVFNQAFERIWKLSTGMLDSKPHIDEIITQARVLHEDDEAWSHIRDVVTEFSDSREPVEGQMTRPDQSVVDFAALPLPDGGTLVTFTDVTVSKRYERALIERNEALIAADRLKSQFISHVSYELRTPLTNIIGFTELLESPRTGPLNGKQREYLGDVSASSRILLNVIDDILDLANIDAGALELKIAPIEVRPIVEGVVVAMRDLLTRARLHLEVIVAPDVDRLVADGARMRQILHHLLTNAIGFSNPGGEIRLVCERRFGMVQFTVTDTGVGIPREQQRAVLERFVTRTQGSRHRGAGLGLPLVKSLVELHGGQLSLDSEPGKGTTVTVRLPEHGIRSIDGGAQQSRSA